MHAHCAAVRLDADKLDLDPVMVACYVVAQQGWRTTLKRHTKRMEQILHQVEGIGVKFRWEDSHWLTLTSIVACCLVGCLG